MNLVLALVLVSLPTKEWTASGTGITFQVNVEELKATRNGRPTFLFSQRKKLFDDAVQDAAGDAAQVDDPSGWSMEQAQDVLSIVGTVVSIETVATGSLGSRSYSTDDFEAIDAATGQPVAMQDYFPEADIVEALRGDPFLKKRMAKRDLFATAKTLSEFMGAMTPEDPCVNFSAEAIKSAFAFHHVEGDKVALRIALPYATEVCHGHRTIVNVLLPIPEKMKVAIKKAATHEQGFVEVDAKSQNAPHAAWSWKPTKK